jgi:ribosomal protein L11 methyltransferase
MLQCAELEHVTYLDQERSAAMAYYELIIGIPDSYRDMLIQRLTQRGCLGVIEEDRSLVAYFPDTIDLKSLISELDIVQELLRNTDAGHELTFSYSLIPEQDWNESWKKGFTPLDVGERFTILPPWEKKHDDRINLVIDPGMAFGTGHHETTRSCLVLIEKYAVKSAKGRFLDLGTGTGLLAIAASKLGYKEVQAVDTDPLAIEAASMNIELNQVANVELREGSIVEASGMFDCVAANIISAVLVLLAPHIASRLNTTGIAVLSGILSGQEGEVIEAMEKARLTLREKYRDGKWVSLVVEQ